MEEVLARCVPGRSGHRSNASSFRLVARLWAIRDGSLTATRVDAGMSLSRAECGDRGAALRNQDMELEVPDLVRIVERGDAALQSEHSVYTNIDLVWGAGLLVGQRRDRLRQASPAQWFTGRGGRMELLAVPRSRAGHGVLWLAEAAEPWLHPELDGHDAVQLGVCVFVLPAGGTAVAPVGEESPGVRQGSGGTARKSSRSCACGSEPGLRQVPNWEATPTPPVFS